MICHFHTIPFHISSLPLPYLRLKKGLDLKPHPFLLSKDFVTFFGVNQHLFETKLILDTICQIALNALVLFVDGSPVWDLVKVHVDCTNHTFFVVTCHLSQKIQSLESFTTSSVGICDGTV